MYDEKLKAYFQVHKDEIIQDIKSLVDINSERMEPEKDMPFGRGPAACLAKAEYMMQQYGFSTKNYDNYALVADFGPQDRKLDILAHLDVVPAGNDWTVCDPFCMTEVDGRLYGRGTADDKGPAICALYAMRAIKELNIPLKYGVRLILGSDEECGGEDLDYYYAKEKSAPMCFSPDAEFPLIHIEKGGLHSGFTANVAMRENLPRIVKLQGGTKLNMIPAEAECWIEGLSCEEVKSCVDNNSIPEGIQVYVAEECGCTKITTKGVAAHASTPEDGKNAVTALLECLTYLPLSAGELHEKIHAVHQMFPYGDDYGKALMVNLEDEKSGKTTLSLNLLSYDGQILSGGFDCRACILANDENTTNVIYERFLSAGLTPKPETMYRPHIVDEESEIVQKLLSAYNHVTGKEGKPMAIGGGTYVHSIENGVAFGCCELEVDNHLHGADEFMEIAQILMSCEIFAHGILNICG